MDIYYHNFVVNFNAMLKLVNICIFLLKDVSLLKPLICSQSKTIETLILAPTSQLHEEI